MLHLALSLAAVLTPQGDVPLPPSHTGLLYVSGFSTDNVVELAPDGTLLRTFGTMNTRQPRGVAVDDYGNVVVVCQASDRVQVFDLAGTLIREVTHPDLTNGTGISRTGEGNWVIGNFTPGAILEFDSDWQHIQTTTHPGMNGVNCVAVEADGSLSVTAVVNASVHLFSPTRQHAGQIPHPTLVSPMSIARDSTGAHYVSNGGGFVSKFDANWGFLMSFGQGLVSQPQGIVVDENDVLTVTNFSSSTVHRFDVDGTLLASFPLVGAVTGRNAAWQTSQLALAMAGSARDATGAPERSLSVNGTSGGAIRRVTLGPSDALSIDLDLPQAFGTGAGASAGAVVYAWIGAPSLSTPRELTFEMGLMSQAPPFLGGSPSVLTNSIQREDFFGVGLGQGVFAPGAVLDLPGGASRPITLTLQALIQGPNGLPLTTNAIVLEVQ